MDASLKSHRTARNQISFRTMNSCTGTISCDLRTTSIMDKERMSQKIYNEHKLRNKSA